MSSSATQSEAGGPSHPSDAPILLHDIRNHLNAVGGLVQLMSGGVMRIGPHDAIEVAQQSIEALLVKLELLRSGPVDDALVARTRHVDCVRLASLLCAAFSPMASQRGARLNFQTQLPAVRVRVDSLSLNRILSNLIVNAIRHSACREIEVSVRTGEAGVLFRVCDRGVGLPARVREVLLDLLSGRPVPIDYARHGLLSCIKSAEAAGAKLQLVEEWSPGVCWELSVPGACDRSRPLRAGANCVCEPEAIAA